MKNLVFKGLLFAVCTFALNAAQAKGNYGMAGCGLGAMLFKGKNDTVSQILAATTNGTSGNQTFGITTGTLECTDAGGLNASRAKEIFSEANYDKLAMDMARGNGEYLAAFSSFYGCSNAEQTKSFSMMTQSNFEEITASGNHLEMIQKVDALAVGQCGA